MIRRSSLALACLVSTLCAAAPASANGRFPLAQQLVEDESDANHLVLRTTFGIVSTHDRGKTWSWICEKSVGYSGTEDPSLGITQDGTLVAGIFDGLRTSTDSGCDWKSPSTELDGKYVVDLTVEAADASHAVALTSNGIGGGKFATALWETTDSGASWHALGTALPDTVLGLTLDPAPSNPDRIYVSGVGDGGAAVLMRSSDRGKTWEQLSIPNAGVEASPFIAAIAPNDPDSLYVRTAGTDTNTLLHSADGGDTFTEIFSGVGVMLGFALSPDGQTVLVGYGDPKGGAATDPATLGLWKSATSSFSFTRIAEGPINCLRWTSTGLYACGSEFVQGFELGFAKDASFDISTANPFEPLMHLSEVDGPLTCNGSTTGAVCADEWQPVCTTIGKCTTDADAGADAGTGGSGSGGGSGVTPPDEEDPGDCNCRAAGSRGGGLGALALTAAALGVALSRRRR
ncbi:MAG: hypothetical protein KC776_20440 [Myxococcales bacterium]|nr:hypothetical protein [Myxococcales bacterium]MCB9577301.1 hypothetical protein [Polyangiaceae bacterium]